MIDELEWQTRRDRINRKLRALKPAWKIVKYSDELDTSKLDRHAVEEYPTGKGPADYALFVKGQLLGILEAKKVKVGPQNVLEQAKRYSKGAFDGPGRWNGYRVPFLYASNGEIIWFIDVRNAKNISRQISSFHTAVALNEFYADDKSQGLPWLKKNPINIERLRGYQRKAIKAIESAMIKGKRAMLVAMATGTGKTFTTVSLIYHLLQAKATLIAAALEFSRRRIKPEGLKISFPPDVLPLIRHYADRKQEHFLCISLNSANEVITTRVASVGLLNKIQVHPREVFADPITDRASAIIVAHNHPTGGLIPIKDDVAVTKQQKAAGQTLGIKLLDHIIFNHKSYYSFLERGEM